MSAPEPLVVFAGDLTALLLAWLVGAIVLQFFQRGARKTAVLRGLGIAIIALVSLMALRLVLPDLLGLPLVFINAAVADIATSRRLKRNPRQPMISVLAALFVVGALVLVDAALRAVGYHVTLLT